MPYLIALALVLAFTVNVVLGAIGSGRLFGNATEMLVLFAAATAFSVGILRSEARAKSNKTDVK